MSTRISNILATLLLLLTACRTQLVEVERPVVVEHTTTSNHLELVRDTLLMRDSIYHYVMGDTVIIERWHHTADLHHSVIRDTVRDTVPQVVTERVTQVKQVNHLHWWQQALAWTGAAALIALVIFIITKLKK